MPRKSEASGTADLTTEEQEHVRTVMRFLRARCGGWAQVALVLKYKRCTVEDAAAGHGPVSASMAFRVARFLGSSIDEMIAGKFIPPTMCPYCKQAVPE